MPRRARSPSRSLRSRRASSLVLLTTSTAAAALHGAYLKRRAQRFLSTLELHGVELSLTLTSDARIRKLNRAWRARDVPTDVLSFPAGPISPEVFPKPLGDVVISVDTARRMARQLGTSVREELELYLAHGLLHLLGYDHDTDAQEREMRTVESSLLGSPGMLARAC